MATKDYDLPFNDEPVKTKKEFNQHLSAQSKKFQSLNTFPTFGLWGALYDAVAPVIRGKRSPHYDVSTKIRSVSSIKTTQSLKLKSY